MAVELLTPTTCELALANVPATLAKVKAERASCDSLITKLCGDLPPGSAACTIVKDRTPSFPRERCDEMLKHYAEVLQQLKELDQQQGMQMPPGMHPGGPGMPAPGAAPGAQPPGAGPGAQPPGAPPNP
jgi:hypothetical protein